MTPTEAKKWLKHIINQRVYTLNHNCCHRNKMLMANTCQRMNTLLSANPYHGNSIFGFIRRHYTDIMIIIPANQAEKKNLQILKQLALCNASETSTPMSDSIPEPTQLALFS